MHVEQDKFCHFDNQSVPKAIPTSGATVEGSVMWMDVMAKVVRGDISEEGGVLVGTPTIK